MNRIVSSRVRASRLRRASLASLLLGLTLITNACAMPRRAETSAGVAPANSSDALSPVERVELFDEVWKTIDERYYDASFNGADWRGVRARYRPCAEAARDDRSLYILLEVMLAELRDGHTHFQPPAPPVDAQKNVLRGRLGLRLAEADGQVVVAEVEPDSEAARAGLKPGMSVLEVNGQPVADHFAYLRSVFAGSSSERLMKNKMLAAVLHGGFLSMPRTLGLVDFDGRHFDVKLSPRETPPPPNLHARRLASGVGYIKFSHWTPPVEEEFRRELTNLMDAPALIIDLRGNGGGEARVLLDIASNFFGAPTYYGGFRNRAGELRKHFTRQPARLYAGALAILVDERSASASESFSIFMQESGRARIVGRRSAGSTLNLTGGERSFKGGGKLFFSTHAYISPRGRNPEGTGVVPDLSVPLTVEDLRAGRDAALEAAELLLRDRVGASRRAGLGRRRKSALTSFV